MKTGVCVIRRVWPAVVSVFLLTACGPTYYLAMKLAQSSGRWVDGHEISQEVHDSVEVHVGVVRYGANGVIFEVNLHNYSARPVLVEPASFYYLPVATLPIASTAALELPGRVGAMDPEPRLQQLTTSIGYEAEQATKVSTSEVLSGLGNIVESVASIKKKETQEQINEREQRHRNDAIYYENQRLQHAANADLLLSEKQELEQYALRKNTLERGQSTRGYVYFSRTDMADLLRLVVRVNEYPLTFDYAQTRIKQ
jgi:hypothetical protein